MHSSAHRWRFSLGSQHPGKASSEGRRGGGEVEGGAGEALPEPDALQHPYEEAQAGHRAGTQRPSPRRRQRQGRL